jgi:hypothetical protein
VPESGRQRGFEVSIDVEDGVGVGQLEDVEDPGCGGDEAKLAAANFHVAVEDHECAQAGAVDEFDGGEIEDESFNAVSCGVGDLLIRSRAGACRGSCVR